MMPQDVKQSTQQKLENAKTKLMLENPYFGSLVTSIELRVNNNIASINPLGDVLEYNEEYLEVLSVNEVSTILANGAMHQALFHSERGEGKVSSIWRLASDYAINDLLVENGFMLPPMANYASRFERLYAEQLYTTLLCELDLTENDNDPVDEQQTEEFEQNIQRLTPQESLEPSLKGGGGTNFTPVFDHIMQMNEDFKFLIYFTDGKGSFPNYKPNIDVLWVVPKVEGEFPFGEVLELKKQI